MKAFSILIQAYFTGQACEPKETSMRPCGTIKEAFWDFPLVWDKKRWSHPILEFLHWDEFKIDWDFDLAHSKPMAQSNKSWWLNLNIPMALKPWHQKGGSQLDSELSGGPWALKMESLTECTVCAILKMSSDNSSFETGVGILWLMCTWAFQVLYSRAWQTSVTTWPGVRDIWMLVGVE